MYTRFSLLKATVGHERLHPKRNKFAYSVFYVRIPITKKLVSEASLFSFDKLNILSIKTAMHGKKDGSDLYDWVIKTARNHNLTIDDTYLIDLITHPRYLGFAFNPISYWMIRDSEKNLLAVVCEVRNTFGDSHNYFIAHTDFSPIEETDMFTANKNLYVSPFNPNEGYYTFSFSYNDTSFRSVINYYNDSTHILSTYMGGNFSELTNLSIIKSVFLYPFLTFKVVFLIHYQAVKLYLMGINNTLKKRNKDYTSNQTTSVQDLN